jgi:hypothetical protein
MPVMATESKSTSFNFGANIMAKSAAKKKAATKKKPAVNKSDAVRKFAADHPEASTQEIATALGFEYTTVYQAMKKKSGKKKAKRKVSGGVDHGGAKHGSNGHSATEFVKAALGLGLDSAIKLLEKVKKAVG